MKTHSNNTENPQQDSIITPLSSNDNSYRLFIWSDKSMYFNDMNSDCTAREGDLDFSFPVSVLGQDTVIDIIRVAVSSQAGYPAPTIYGLSKGTFTPPTEYTRMSSHIHTIDLRYLPKSERILPFGSTLKLVYPNPVPASGHTYRPMPFRTTDGRIVAQVTGIPQDKETPVMVCRNCRAVEAHVPGKKKCSKCNSTYSDLIQQTTLCKNCGQVYNPNESPHCYSCGLHVQQAICLDCGQNYFYGFDQDSYSCPCCKQNTNSTHTEYYAYHDDSNDYQATYYEEAMPTEYGEGSNTYFPMSRAGISAQSLAQLPIPEQLSSLFTEHADDPAPAFTPLSAAALRAGGVVLMNASSEGSTEYPPTEYVYDDIVTEYPSPNGMPVADDPENLPSTQYCAVDPDSMGSDSGNDDGEPNWSTPTGGGTGAWQEDENNEDSSIPGTPLPTGHVGFNSSTLAGDLINLNSLTFRHITERRIGSYNSPTGQIRDALQVAVINEYGYPRFSGFTGDGAGTPIDRSAASPERLSKITIGSGDDSGIPFNTFCFEEVLANGTVIRYSSETGEALAIKLPECKWMTREQWENDLKVIYHSEEGSAPPITEISDHIAFSMRKRPGKIRQIWNRRDGLMDFLQTSEHSFEIHWYAPGSVGEYDDGNRIYQLLPGAQPVKSWCFTGTPYEYTLNGQGEKVHTATGDILTDDDLDYLYTLSITEQRGDLSFTKSWERPNANTLIYTKGEGNEAESIMTVTAATDPVTEEELRQSGLTLDAAYLKVGDTFTHEIEKTVTVPGLPGGTLTRTRRYPFGDVCTYEEAGIGTPESTHVSYWYETNRNSRNYGCLIAEFHSNGKYVSYNYDRSKRLISKTEPTHGGQDLVTYTTYCNIKDNDRRIASVTEGVGEHNFTRTLFSRVGRPGLMETKTTRLYSGESQSYATSEGTSYGKVPYTEYTWKYDNDHPQWPGKLAKQVTKDGKYKFYDYEKGDTADCAFKMIVTDNAWNANFTSGQTARTIYTYDSDQLLKRKQDYAYISGRFILTAEESYTHDLSGNVIRTDFSDGTFSTAEWICKGPISETDRDGRTTTYHYNSAKRLSRITRSGISFRFPGTANAPHTTHPDEVTEYTFDPAGRTLTSTVTIGDKVAVTSSSYDALGRTLTRTDEEGLVTSYSYYADGLITLIETPSGSTYITQQDITGELVYEGGDGQQDRQYICSYATGNQECLLEKKEYILVDGEWSLQSRAYTTGSGKTRSQSVAAAAPGNNILFEAKYDAQGRIVSQIYDQHADYDRLFSYDSASGLTRESVYVNDYTWLTTDTYTSYVIREHDIDLPQAPRWLTSPQVWRRTLVQTSYSGDTAPPITSVSWQLVSQTTPGIGSASISQDKYGRVTTSWNEKQDNLVYQYSLLPESDLPDCSVQAGDRLVYSDSRTGETASVTYQWLAGGEQTTVTDGRGVTSVSVTDLSGRQVSQSDGQGRTTTWEYDPLTGQMTVETNPLGQTLRYSYDTGGRVSSQYGTAAQPLKFEYDDAGRLIRLHTFRNPQGIITADPAERTDGDITVWEYNPLSGFLSGKTTPDGQTTSYYYNERNQVVEKRTAKARTSYSYDYYHRQLISITHNDGSPGATFTYDRRAMLTSVTDASGTRTFHYDNLLDLTTEDLPGSGQFALHYKRTSTGLPVGYSLTMDGHHVQNVLHYHDDTTRIAGFQIDKDKPFLIQYKDGSSLPEHVQWPEGIKQTTLYDPHRNIPASITYNTKANNRIKRETYSYDDASRLTARQAEGKTHNYGYNDKSELTLHTITGGVSHRYSYDNIGNRIDAVNSSGTTLYTANMANRYTGISEGQQAPFLPGYDSEGNQLTARTGTGDWTITWNADNRPVSFTKDGTTITCAYDYMGRRTSKKEYRNNTLVSEKNYIYQGYRLIAETDSATTDIKTWVWNPLGGSHSTPLQMNIISKNDILNPPTSYPGGNSEYPGEDPDYTHYPTGETIEYTFFPEWDPFVYRHDADPVEETAVFSKAGVVLSAPGTGATYLEINDFELVLHDRAGYSFNAAGYAAISVNGAPILNIAIQESSNGVQPAGAGSIYLPAGGALSIAVYGSKEGQITSAPLLGSANDSLVYMRIMGQWRTGEIPDNNGGSSEYPVHSEYPDGYTTYGAELYRVLTAASDSGGDTPYPELPTAYPESPWTFIQFPPANNELYVHTRYPGMEVVPGEYTMYDMGLEEDQRFLYETLRFASECDYSEVNQTAYGFEADLKRLQGGTQTVPADWSQGIFSVDLVAGGLSKRQRTSSDGYGVMVDFYLINKITGERIIPAFVLMNRGDNYKPIAQYTGTVIAPSPIEGDFSDPAYGTEDIPELPRTRYNYLTDHNKNITTLTDTAGTPLITYQYDAYGNLLNTLTAFHQTLNPFRFSSEYYDHELDLIYYNYRHYNPKDGRWLSKDPIEEQGGWNLYGFVDNRSNMSFDNFGLAVKTYDKNTDELILMAKDYEKQKFTPGGTAHAKHYIDPSSTVIETIDDYGNPCYMVSLNGHLDINLFYNKNSSPSSPRIYSPIEFNTTELHERHHAKIYKHYWNIFAERENNFEDLRFCTKECAKSFGYAVLTSLTFGKHLGEYKNAEWDVEQITEKYHNAINNKNSTKETLAYYKKWESYYKYRLERDYIALDRAHDIAYKLIKNYLDSNCKCWHKNNQWMTNDKTINYYCPSDYDSFLGYWEL